MQLIWQPAQNEHQDKPQDDLGKFSSFTYSTTVERVQIKRDIILEESDGHEGIEQSRQTSRNQEENHEFPPHHHNLYRISRFWLECLTELNEAAMRNECSDDTGVHGNWNCKEHWRNPNQG